MDEHGRGPARRAISRRAFCEGVAGGALALPLAASGSATEPPAAGDWPTARQNNRLTGAQSLAGRMARPPRAAGRLEFGAGHGTLRPFALRPGGEPDRVLEIASGVVRCYRPDGGLAWEEHPLGLNFDALVAAEDIDGDGRVELALTAGRPTQPYGAAVLLDAETGRTILRYDVEPMSYDWKLLVDHYLPGGAGKQIIVIMHGYPPDTRNGYVVLFDFKRPGAPPRQRWRYDFDHYTCFPSVLMADVDGDGTKELCIETHSHMWVMDALTGAVRQYVEWDTAPASVRSYGLIRFQDLNGDGLPEFLCIGDFATHHEVLLNDRGKLKLAWLHAWPESVTTRAIATSWPDPPVADIDGDGRLEMLVNMFKATDEARWAIRIYDALTGDVKAMVWDRVAVQTIDLDGDGAAEVLADVSTDPNRSRAEGACLLKWRDGSMAEVWSEASARAVSPPRHQGDAATAMLGAARVQSGGVARGLTWSGKVVVAGAPSPAPAPRTLDLSRIPARSGSLVAPPVVADVDGDGVNEVVHAHGGKVSVYRWGRDGAFEKLAEHRSDAQPVLADVDGDGRPELLVGTASVSADPVVRAVRLGAGGGVAWQARLERPKRAGLPFGRPLYFQTGRFLGRKGDDVYVYVGTPLVRSLMLDGSTGRLVWELEKLASIERYLAPTRNLAAVWDTDGDAREDLVFTCPDYYCVASGPTGKLLVGPRFPPEIFKQPSQGLYTMPVVLDGAGGPPTVCLVDGHYFEGAMSDRAAPKWYRLPTVGHARAGAEGFLRDEDGRWLMGIGRQDGVFACVDVETGRLLWEYPTHATPSGVVSGDVDGDGRAEFVFGTSHGHLYALRPERKGPRLVWRVSLPGWVGEPVLADVDGDGASEILVPVADGTLTLLKGATRASSSAPRIAQGGTP